MTQQPQFEKVDAGSGTSAPVVFRLSVPGGWIYHMTHYHNQSCAVFVPKPVLEHVRTIANSAAKMQPGDDRWERA